MTRRAGFCNMANPQPLYELGHWELNLNMSQEIRSNNQSEVSL